MYILGIETSCDETSAAVLKDNRVLSNVIFSQVSEHRAFGGVVPEIAAREHMNKIPVVVDEALKKAGVKLKVINCIAATYGPGLAGALITGLSYAKGLAFAMKKKFIGINHLEAHLLSPFLEYPGLKFPFTGLVVSGGHTNVYLAEKPGKYELIGSTRDDAAGEAFDKVAKMLNLPYPGGPSVSKAARAGDAGKVVFPQARMKDESFDFSFSGLKTSVLYFLQKNRERIDKGEITINDIAAAFQKAAARSIVNKMKKVHKKHKAASVVLAGGVAANKYLKDEMKKFAEERGIRVYIPSPVMCTDNGAMVAYAGLQHVKQKKYSGFDIEAEPNLKL